MFADLGAQLLQLQFVRFNGLLLHLGGLFVDLLVDLRDLLSDGFFVEQTGVVGQGLLLGSLLAEGAELAMGGKPTKVDYGPDHPNIIISHHQHDRLDYNCQYQQSNPYIPHYIVFLGLNFFY